jgi:hypothetical protein
MITHAPVSVIVPCYNSEKTIGRALHSVLNQTIPVAEVIVIDDCSSDHTVEKALSYQEMFANKHIDFFMLKNESNNGASYSRNRGMERAKSKYIAFLDSDDAWHPLKTELQIKLMEDNQEVFILGGYQQHIKSDMEEMYKEYEQRDMNNLNKKTITKKSSIFKNPTQTSVVMMRNNQLVKFDERKRLSEDYLLWLEYIYRGRTMVQLEGHLAVSFKHHYGESGLSSNILKLELAELDTLNRIKRNYSKSLKEDVLFTGAFIFSMIKFIRRAIIVVLQNTRRKMI